MQLRYTGAAVLSERLSWNIFLAVSLGIDVPHYILRIVAHRQEHPSYILSDKTEGKEYDT